MLIYTLLIFNVASQEFIQNFIKYLPKNKIIFQKTRTPAPLKSPIRRNTHKGAYNCFKKRQKKNFRAKLRCQITVNSLSRVSCAFEYQARLQDSRTHSKLPPRHRKHQWKTKRQRDTWQNILFGKFSRHFAVIFVNFIESFMQMKFDGRLSQDVINIYEIYW